MTFWPTSISCVDFFLCDFRWSTGREKSWEVCSSVNIHCKHTWAPSILHASSGAPGVPLAPAVATVLMRTAEICLPISEFHTGGYIYSTCSVILWFFYSVSCLQSVFRECRSVSMYCLCLCFCFTCCRLSLSDWVTVYLPIFFKYIWIVSNILLINYVFDEKRIKVKWKYFRKSH